MDEELTDDQIFEQAQAKAIEAFGTDTDDDDEPAAAKPAKAKAKKADDEAADEDGDEDEEGDDGDDPKVSATERAKFRRYRRAEIEKLERRRNEGENHVRRLARQEHDRLAPLATAAQALDRNDFDGFASAVASAIRVDAKDWNALNAHILKTFQSPEHRKIAELERERAADRRAADERQRQANLTAASEARQAKQRRYLGELQAGLKDSEDPAVSALAEDPEFIHAVFAEQRKQFQKSKKVDEELAVAQALKRAEKRFQVLQAAFGKPSDGAGYGNGERKPAKRGKKQVLRSRSAEGVPNGEMTDDEWLTTMTRQMENATGSA
jgi:hypothetical protein